jgi:hydroxyacylglutathione hydrolase
MKIHKIPKGPISANSYIIETETTSVLIDPCVSIAHLPNLKSPISKIIITHCHYDHVTFLDEIKHATNATVYSHELEFPSFNDAAKNGSAFFMSEDTFTKPDKSIDENDEIILDSENKLKFLHTPGHTMGSICVLLYENGFCTTAFTGDTLFKCSIGRTDLAGSPVMLDKSLEKLKLLDDKVKVMSGHGPDSTIGYEKKYNPFM